MVRASRKKKLVSNLDLHQTYLRAQQFVSYAIVPVKSYSWSVLNCCFESLLCGSPVALHCNSTFCTCVRLCRDVYVMIIYNRLDKHTSICCMWGTWIVNYSCNMEARTKRSCHKRQPLVLLKVCCIFCRCVNFIYLNGYKAYPLSLVFNTQRFK